jgi:hypothetical protein
MLISHNQWVRDDLFTGEWENLFFLRNEREVRLRCRVYKVEGETYISGADWDYKLDDQDRNHLRGMGVPMRFYRQQPVCRTTVMRDPLKPKTPTPAVATAEIPKRKTEPRPKAVECSFLWGSDIGDFIIDSMDGHPDYRVEFTGADTIAVFSRKGNQRLNLGQVLEFKRELETDDGSKAA